MSIHALRTCRPALNLFAQTTRYNAFRTTESKRFMSFTRKFGANPAISWKSVILAGITGSAMVYWIRKKEAENEIKNKRRRARVTGKEGIGGPWELVDPDGKLRTSEEFKGQWLLIYFGFTHCPDVCPDELEKMVKTFEFIEKNSDLPNVVPIFISVDPARDTPEMVGKYIKEFSPKFLGLTGNAEQVEKVCRTFRVYYSAAKPDEDNDYIVDHTIVIYLMNPDGKFVDYFLQTSDVDEVAEGIEMKMLQYMGKHK